MPFTFSHPAIVLPMVYLLRRWISLTGLIIGSMTPDFEYFIRMKPYSAFSHTVFGSLWFNLPLGLILAFVFHLIVRDKLIENSPVILRSRLSDLKGFDWNNYFRKRWLTVIISMLIGALLHIFWDGFTHKNGCFVETFHTLTTGIQLFGIKIPAYKFLQHFSSLLGAFVIAIAVWKLPKAKLTTNHMDRTYWLSIITITTLIVMIRFLSGLDYRFYGHVIVTFISAAMIAIAMTSLLLDGINAFYSKKQQSL